MTFPFVDILLGHFQAGQAGRSHRDVKHLTQRWIHRRLTENKTLLSLRRPSASLYKPTAQGNFADTGKVFEDWQTS